MNEKELRKLKRLEILELLLEQSRLNETLQQELYELKNKNNADELTANLEKMILQMNSALEHVEHISDRLYRKENKEHCAEKNYMAALFEQKNSFVSNKNLYSRIMYFFWQNDDFLSSLPQELQKDIREKFRGILNEK